MNEEIIRKIKFTLFSASAGLIEIGLFTLLNEFASFDYWISYLTALIISVIWNFTLNRNITFKSTSNVLIAMIKVAAFYLIFIPSSTLIGNYLVENIKINEYIVTAINMIMNFILEYLYDKYIVFKK